MTKERPRRNLAEHPNRSLSDLWVFRKIMDRTRGKYWFCENNLDEQLPSFTTVLSKAYQVKPELDSQGDYYFINQIDFGGLSYLKTRIRTLKKGVAGGPTIIVIPGYGSVSQLVTTPYLTALEGLDDCRVLGIEVFHGLSEVDRVKVGSSVQNLQMAFASAMVACDYAVRMAHSQSSPVLVLGQSFGAKAINAMLNMVGSSVPFDLAEAYVAIEGGRFDQTFTGPAYLRHMVDPGIVNHPAIANGSVFPDQAPTLPIHPGTHVTAVINPQDDVALGQTSCWAGTDKTLEIKGLKSRSHLTAPMINVFKIRRVIADAMQNLRA